MPDRFVSYPVPYCSQYASPELIRAFIHQGLDPATDPNWASYGAQSPQEYAHWALRACGVVCVKMAADALNGAGSGPVMDWVRAGLAVDGYLTEIRPDRPDKPVEKGWKHIALARLLIDRGYDARLAADLTVDRIAGYIRDDRLVIASVTSELGESGPLTRRSGHLVVIFGVTVDDAGQVTHLILHNPSGRTATLREGARIATGRFVQGFSGRGIVVGR